MINGETKVAGVIGNPIKHSASPKMHNAAFDSLSMNAVYLPFEIEPDRLSFAIESVRALNLLGINVTVPYKEKVIPYLDELDDFARQCGAVNTIVNREGKLIGYNTDGEGFFCGIDFDFKGKRVALIGAGGAARGVCLSLIKRKVSSLVVLNRTELTAMNLKQTIQKSGFEFVETYSLDDTTVLSSCDIVIQTTSVGLYPKVYETPVLDFDWVRESQLICDIIYKPAQTELMKQAAKKGATVLGGSGMLAGQGAVAFELFTGQKAPYKVMLDTLSHV